MNRKTSIIISITGITIIGLMLLGFTYGYFITKIIGNTNSKSVNVTLGKTSVEYTDLSTEDLNVIIEPGYETIKLFTVKNTGTVAATYSIYLDEVVNEFIRTDDITYILYRKSGNNTIDTTDLSDCEVIATGVYPKINSFIKLDEVIETPNNYYTYALKITYINSEENQNEDQGHTFSGKVQIYDVKEKNPFTEGTLAYNIVNNALSLTDAEKNAGYAELVATPPTKVAEEISGTTESVLSITSDDLGTSYYYRGAVKNNYLEFNEMCWRIVRIEGDGSIKLTLAAQKSCSSITTEDTGSAFIGTGDYGYNTFNEVDYENSANRTSSMKYILNEWFNTNFNTNDEQKLLLSKIKNNQICLGNTDTKYDETGNIITSTNSYLFEKWNRLNNLGLTQYATLICHIKNMKTKENNVYTLTVDEVLYAGGHSSESNFYLKDNATENWWWTITPAGYDSSDGGFSIIVQNNGALAGYGVLYSGGYIRPSISLTSGVLINNGNGSITSPYTIK